MLDELSVAGMDDAAQRLALHLSGALYSGNTVERGRAEQRLLALLKGSLEQNSQAMLALKNALGEADSHKTTAGTPPVDASSGAAKSALGQTRKVRRQFEALEEQIQAESAFQIGAAIGGGAPAEARQLAPLPGSPPQSSPSDASRPTVQIAPPAPGTLPVSSGKLPRAGGSASSQAGKAVDAFPTPASRSSSSATNARVASASSAGAMRIFPSLKNSRPMLEGQLQDMGLVATISMVGGKEGVLKIDGPFEGRIFIRYRRIVTAVYGQKIDLDALIEIDRLKKAGFGFFTQEFSLEGSLNLEIAKLAEVLQSFRDGNNTKLFQ
jgi:hypothetical protein